MEQIEKVAEAGADIVRVAVPRDKDIEALKQIVKRSPIPIIADIHFNHTLALKAIEAGADCIRLNPGNIGGPDKVAEVAALANKHNTPMRIGVNSGSLPKHRHALGRENSVEALVTDKVPPGTGFMTFHYEESPVNELTNSAYDPVTLTAEFKVCAVRVEKCADGAAAACVTEEVCGV